MCSSWWCCFRPPSLISHLLCPARAAVRCCSTPSCTQPHTKRKPNLERTCMPTHCAISPQIVDPRAATPPLSYHVGSSTAFLILPLPLTCMTPNSSRDRLTVCHGCFHAWRPWHKHAIQDLLPDDAQGNTRAQAIRSCLHGACLWSKRDETSDALMEPAVS